MKKEVLSRFFFLITEGEVWFLFPYKVKLTQFCLVFIFPWMMSHTSSSALGGASPFQINLLLSFSQDLVHQALTKDLTVNSPLVLKFYQVLSLLCFERWTCWRLAKRDSNCFTSHWQMFLLQVKFQSIGGRPKIPYLRPFHFAIARPSMAQETSLSVAYSQPRSLARIWCWILPQLYINYLYTTSQLIRNDLTCQL